MKRVETHNLDAISNYKMVDVPPPQPDAGEVLICGFRSTVTGRFG